MLAQYLRSACTLDLKVLPTQTALCEVLLQPQHCVCLDYERHAVK
jgi:hypothetical protein